MAKKEAFTAGNFKLEVDGRGDMGFVKKVSGGAVKSELKTQNLGSSPIQKKTIDGLVKHDDFTFEIGMGMCKGMYEWMEQTFRQGPKPTNGDIHALDFEQVSRARIEFDRAYITEFTMPALTAGTGEPVYMTVKLGPTEVKYLRGTEKKEEGRVGSAQKAWNTGAFKFSLGDLPCGNVYKIDTFSWKASLVDAPTGDSRIPERTVGKIEVPNLKLTIGMQDLGPWLDYHEKFTVKGKTPESAEKTGILTLLPPDRDEGGAHGDITFGNMGIISMQYDGFEANKEEIARFTVELYCEEMKFNIKPSATDA